jgi:hypothetical protein
MSNDENTGELAAIANSAASQSLKDGWLFQMKVSGLIIAFNAMVLGWNIKELLEIRRLQQQLKQDREAVPTLKLELGPIPVPAELIPDLQT